MKINVGHHVLGAGAPAFIIAEAGVNHNGNVDLARRLVDAAADAGASAVKFQTFDPKALAAATAPHAEYQRLRAGGVSQHEMLARLVLPREVHVELKARAESRALGFLSSPFDESSADFLVDIGVAALKIPSGEVTNHPFLKHVARTGLPLLVSTGMCMLDEVEGAVATIRSAGTPPLALLHCVSSYPADPGDANLRAMATLRTRFGVPVGWSDHTTGVDVSVAAAALGAELIEKHLTLDRSLPGPDHAASLEPSEFARLVVGVRAAEAALGDGQKRPRPAEIPIAAVSRKSLHWRISPSVGERVRVEHLIALRPGTGLSPTRLDAIVGCVVCRAVEAGVAVDEADLSPQDE
jgi:N-acetylneuraminate synthase/N,N'-diacetyllegionaminate synthase